MKLQTFALSALCAVFVGCGGSDGGKTNEEASVSIHVLHAEAPAYRSTLQARIEDGNGVGPAEVTYSWTNSAGEVVGTEEDYEIGSAQIGETIKVAVSFTDFEGFDESATSEPTAAVERGEQAFEATFFESDLSESIENDAEAPLQGTLRIDDEPLQAFFEEITDLSGTYGTFSLESDGDYTYTLDTTDPAVIALSADPQATLAENILVRSIDGTEATLVITITSAYDGPTSRVAQISDTNFGGTKNDTGELRYKDSSVLPLTQGKLTFSFNKDVADSGEVDADGNPIIQDAYVALYGPTTSSSEALLDLRIQDDNFLIRGRDDISFPMAFVPEQWYDVEMTWDVTQTDMVSLTIDGTNIGSFSSGAIADSDVSDLATWFADGVTTIQFRFSDNSRMVDDGSFYVDNIKLYSDVAGTVLVFEDDFEGPEYALEDDPETPDVENSLDEDNSLSPYNNNTAEAIVVEVAVDGDSGS